AIHSIKGGAGAFGVDEVSALAHAMESLLDDVRSGARPTAEMSAALFAGVDHLRRALEARRDGHPVDAGVHAPVIERIVAARAAKPAEPAWRVRFAPHAHLMRSGNDPLRMLRQLHALGATDVVADVSRVPPLAELDPTAIHL